MYWTGFAMPLQWWCPFCHQTNHIWQFTITRHIICPRAVFLCGFSGGVHFAITLTIFGNLPFQDILYMSWTGFAVWVQWWCPFCYQTNHIWQFAIMRHIIYVPGHWHRQGCRWPLWAEFQTLNIFNHNCDFNCNPFYGLPKIVKIIHCTLYIINMYI